MEFVLRWSEEVHAGNVTANGSAGTYTVTIPIAVEQLSSQDLGNCGNTPAPTVQQPQATTAPNNSLSLPPCLGNCWKYDDNARTMIWTGVNDGTEDIWQGTNEALQKIRSGYTATITTSVAGEIFACVLAINGQSVMSSCGLYQLSAGTYQITSANNSVGGFRWCPSVGIGWRVNGGACK